jgi:hypothetical protein
MALNKAKVLKSAEKYVIQARSAMPSLNTKTDQGRSDGSAISKHTEIFMSGLAAFPKPSNAHQTR